MTGLSAFPLPFHASRADGSAQPRTLRELEMIACSAHLRAKPGWFEKTHDTAIAARWTREAIDQGLTEAQVRHVLAELAHYAELRDARTGIEVSAVDGVWQSDTLIDAELRSRLREAVRVLEEVPEEEKDWHPGSDGQVLDLVHPSLFCLVREVSGGPERAWENPTSPYSKYEFSDRFQWLPTDVDVSADGEAAFRSYVNNVHPEDHRELAAVLPELLTRMLPLLENVLTDLRHPRPRGSRPTRTAGTTRSRSTRTRTTSATRKRTRKRWRRTRRRWTTGTRTVARSSRTPRSSPRPSRATRPAGSSCAVAGSRSSPSWRPST